MNCINDEFKLTGSFLFVCAALGTVTWTLQWKQVRASTALLIIWNRPAVTAVCHFSKPVLPALATAAVNSSLPC